MKQRLTDWLAVAIVAVICMATLWMVTGEASKAYNEPTSQQVKMVTFTDDHGQAWYIEDWGRVDTHFDGRGAGTFYFDGNAFFRNPQGKVYRLEPGLENTK